MSADKIEGLREDVTEFRQDIRTLNQAVQQLIVNQSENKFTKEHVERVEALLTTGIDKLNQTLSAQQAQIAELSKTVFLHSKGVTAVIVVVTLFLPSVLGLLGWNYSQMEALKDRQVQQNVRLTIIEQKLELDPRDRQSISRN